MVTLGIDPGVSKTGFAVVEKCGSRFNILEFGVIKPGKELPLAQKLMTIHSKVDDLCSRYNPEDAAVEDIFFARNARSAIMVSHARGVVLYTLAANSINIYGYSPKEIKLAVVGTGTAEKQQVSRMVSILTGIKEKIHPFDAYDAAAAAICHFNKQSGGRYL